MKKITQDFKTNCYNSAGIININKNPRNSVIASAVWHEKYQSFYARSNPERTAL